MTNNGADHNDGPRTSLEKFLLEEYSNIAQAFFNTVESISSFMKHYIAVASVPPALAVLLLTARPPKEAAFIITVFFTQRGIGLTFLLVTLISLLVMCYVVNLRCDALLYARAVNGIRGYFYDQVSLSPAATAKLCTLPTINTKPAYFEKWYFSFVIAVFATIGTVYFGFGSHLLLESSNRTLGFFFWPLMGLFAVLHFLAYWLLTRHREGSYLK